MHLVLVVQKGSFGRHQGVGGYHPKQLMFDNNSLVDIQTQHLYLSILSNLLFLYSLDKTSNPEYLYVFTNDFRWALPVEMSTGSEKIGKVPLEC